LKKGGLCPGSALLIMKCPDSPVRGKEAEIEAQGHEIAERIAPARFS
jgi:hypothetical protein